MKPKRLDNHKNCPECRRWLPDPRRACVCRHLFTAENFVDGLPDGIVRVVCPECFRMTSAGRADENGVVECRCSHCGERTGGRLAGFVGPTRIPSREKFPHKRNDGWEGREQ